MENFTEQEHKELDLMSDFPVRAMEQLKRELFQTNKPELSKFDANDLVDNVVREMTVIANYIKSKMDKKEE